MVKLISVDRNDWEIGYIAKVSHGNFDYANMDHNKLDPKEGLRMMNLLWKKKHLSVFEFLNFTFYVKVPIFTARQLMRQRTFKYIEKSLRYTKPGEMYWKNEFKHPYQTSIEAYDHLVNSGMKLEEARSVMPLGTLTDIIFMADCRNLMNFFSERLSQFAQENIRLMSEDMLSQMLKNPKSKNISKILLDHYLEQEIITNEQFNRISKK